MENVVAVIVTYNRKELLEKCINKLKNQTKKIDILIVDNASTDGTKNLFLNNEKNILYFNTGENLGGAGGFNYGIKKAVELGYEYLWIMDDDTLPKKNTVEKFFEYDKKLNGNYGFLSSKVLWKDGTICGMNIQKKTKWKRLSSFNQMQRIQYASFVSLFVKSDVIKEVGLPYKEFFIWADDWEFTRRISKKYDCYFAPESVVDHWCNNNIGADIVSSDANRIDRFKYMYRNDVCLYRQDGIDGYFYLLIRTIMHFLRIITKASHKKEKIDLMFNSLKKGFLFVPKIEYVGEKK